MSKSKKIILLISIILIIIPMFSISAFALTEAQPNYLYYDKTTGLDYGAYITRANGEVENMVTFDVHNGALDKPHEICYSLRPAGVYTIYGGKSFTFSLKFDSSNINIGSGQMWEYFTRIYFRTTVNKSGYYPETVIVDSCKVEYIEEDGKTYVTEFDGENHSYIDIKSGLMSNSFSDVIIRFTVTTEGTYTLQDNYMLFYFADSKVRFGTAGEYDREQEKQEANQTGQEGVDQIGSLIPSDTEGLTSAFSKLTKSMIHNNTTCKMNFPGIKIPKLNIQGFEFGNVTLLEEKEIDFEYYFTLIPEMYLKLIRALCTIALVLYCFKEMYGQLSFIFTAKGGGDSE